MARSETRRWAKDDGQRVLGAGGVVRLNIVAGYRHDQQAADANRRERRLASRRPVVIRNFNWNTFDRRIDGNQPYGCAAALDFIGKEDANAILPLFNGERIFLIDFGQQPIDMVVVEWDREKHVEGQRRQRSYPKRSLTLSKNGFS